MTLSRMPSAGTGDLKTDRTQASRDRSAAGSDLSFQDVLRGISRNDKKEGREKEPAVLKDIRNKIDEIEKKLSVLEAKEKISKNPDSKEAKEIEGLKSILEEIKKLVAAMKDNNNTSTDIKPGTNSVTLMSFIKEVLEQIISMLDNQDANQKQNTLDALKKKLGEIKGAADVKENAGNNVKTAEGQQEKPAGLSKSGGQEKDITPEKVVVIDKRTGTADAEKTQAEPDNSKKSGEQSISKEPLKIETQSSKAVSPQTLKAAEAENDKSMQRDMTSLQAGKADQAAQVQRTAAVQGAMPVTKAGLEAMMASITGRALVTLKDGKSELKMNLMPPELGRMSMKFVLEGGRMSGQIVVSTPEAKAIFDQNLGDLQRALQQAGVNIGSLNVSLSDRGQDNAGQPNGELWDRSLAGLFNEKPEEAQREAHRAYMSLFESNINFLA